MSSSVHSKILSDLLASPLVCFSDENRLRTKLQKLLDGGADILHIVSDFDMTLTKYWVDGRRNATSHAVVANSSLTPEKLKVRTQALYEEYYPIEVSPDLTPAAKIPHMEAWWRQVHEVIVEQGISRQDIQGMVGEVGVVWRSGVAALLNLCAQRQVPLLVFSAGLADIILELLDADKLLHPNMHVISNKMIFDDAPPHRCIGFVEPVIHTFNKNESCVGRNESYLQDLEHRTNVILLGDSIGDLKMSEGMKHDVCLTVGFLNHDEDKLLDAYLGNFDVVILRDSPMDWVVELVRVICDGVVGTPDGDAGFGLVAAAK